MALWFVSRNAALMHLASVRGRRFTVPLDSDGVGVFARSAEDWQVVRNIAAKALDSGIRVRRWVSLGTSEAHVDPVVNSVRLSREGFLKSFCLILGEFGDTAVAGVRGKSNVVFYLPVEEVLR